MSGAPIWAASITLALTPVHAGLPDVDSNVLLFLKDGTCGEGFLDHDHDTDLPQWRTVCADPLADGEVLAWAELPFAVPARQPAAAGARP